MNVKKIKSFFHERLIEILCAGVGDLHVDKGIKSGFCYSLVIDWLDKPQSASNHYWRPNYIPSNIQDNAKTEYIKNSMSDEQYKYFVKIGKLFLDYCEKYKSEMNANLRVFKVVEDKDKVVNYSFVTLTYAEQMNKWYLEQNKSKMKFIECGEYIYTTPTLGDITDKTSDEIRIMKFKKFFELFDRETNLYYAAMVNLYFINSKDGKEFRHSIGIHKKPEVVDAKQICYRYAIFDPNIGVHEVADLFECVNEGIIHNKYGKADLKLVGCQYFMAKCTNTSYYE